VLFIYRNIFDVAASYNSRANNVNDLNWARNQDYTVAVSDWNESLKCCLDALNSGHKILPICYENFFDSVDELRHIYDFLGLNLLEDHLQKFQKYVEEAKNLNVIRKDSLSGKQKADILMLADIGSYRRLRDLA